MLVLVFAVLIGLLAGLVRPALGARSARIRITWLPLLALGAVGTAASHLVPVELATVVMGVALATLLVFALVNAHVTGIVVIGIGLLLNLVSIVINNGMPVRGEALVAAHIVDASDLASVNMVGPRHLETNADRLGVLGDVLPIPAARAVMSFGDLIVIAGVIDALRDLARRRRRTWNGDDRVTYDSTMTQLKAVHDWGAAPSGAPDSGSQYSAKPDLTDPLTIDLTKDDRTAVSQSLEAANHSR